MQEIWKDIPWYEWLYQASSLWEIKSLFYRRYGYPKIMIWWTNNFGYRKVSLLKDWLSRSFFVHRLVCLTFLWKNEKKKEVNHKNWIKTDNRIENLEWCTRSENNKHKYSILWFKSTYQIHHPNKWKFWKDSIRSKSVLQYSIEWELIGEFWWVKEAWRKTWIPNQNISACCRWLKYNKTAGGFIWKFK